MNVNLPAVYDNLTQRQRTLVSKEYVRRQENKCWHCGKPLDKKPVMDKPIDWYRFPPNFLGNPVHLHHSHATGLTLGAVHAYCNAVLWQYHGE